VVNHPNRSRQQDSKSDMEELRAWAGPPPYEVHRCLRDKAIIRFCQQFDIWQHSQLYPGYRETMRFRKRAGC
jgi:hypothetical protein